jgi:Flp pilus assembly protein CpaB
MPRRISDDKSKKLSLPLGGGSLFAFAIVTIFAVGVGFTLAFKVLNASEHSKESIVVGSFDTVSVPVPVDIVPIGTAVKDINLKYVRFPKHQLPEGALLNFSNLQNRFVKATLPASLPIFLANLSSDHHVNNPVSAKIPEGMRAMTIEVTATSSVEGWAGSGSFVDVLLVTPKRSTVIAEKVKVLSAERVVAPIDGSPSAAVPRTVTLLVTQEQCLTISTALPHGKISFALRNQSDEGVWSNSSFESEKIVNSNSDKIVSKVAGVFKIKDSDGQEREYALRDNKWELIGE